MAIKTQLDSLQPGDDLDTVVARVNANLNLVMEAIYDLDRRVDALADEVAKLRPAEPVRDDDAATD